MIAPEPFFEPRGTPFSEFHRIKALTALGHEIDLVTYPFGQSVEMPGLRGFRSGVFSYFSLITYPLRGMDFATDFAMHFAGNVPKL